MSQYSDLPSGARVVSDPQQYSDIPAGAKAVNPAPVQPQAEYKPLAGLPALERFMLGAGKSVVDIGRGLKQIGIEGGNKLGMVDDQTVADYREHIDTIAQEDAPIMADGYGLAGNISGTLATTLLPVGMAGAAAKGAGLARTGAALGSFVNPASAVSAATAGAIQGGIQPVGTDGSRLTNSAIGAGTGLASNAVLKGAGKIAQPVKNQLGKGEQWAYGVLEKAGVPLDLAQKNGSGLATRAAAYLDDNPATVTAQQEFRQSQQQAYNRAVLAKIGENADAATPDVLNGAATRMGQVFDDFANRNPIKFDGLLNKRLQMIGRNAQKELPAGEVTPILNQIQDITEKAKVGGSINGRAYQNIRSSLDRISTGTNQALGHFAREIRSSLDEAMERYASDADKAAIKAARTGWRRLKQIEDAVDKNELGDIVPTRLFNAVSKKSNRSQVLRGRGDQELVDIARAGKVLLKSKTPNSGTAARVAMQLGPGTVLGIGTLAAGGDLEDAAKVAGVTYVAPKAIQHIMNNSGMSSAMAQGLPPGVLRQLLESPQNSAVVGGLLRHAPVAAASAGVFQK